MPKLPSVSARKPMIFFNFWKTQNWPPFYSLASLRMKRENPMVRSALRPWDEIRPASVLARAVVGMKSWLFYHSSNMWLLAYHAKLLQPFTGAPLRQISGARTCRAFSLPKHYSQGWCAFWLLKREFQSDSLHSPMHWNCEKAWSHFTLVLNNKKGSSFYQICKST